MRRTRIDNECGPDCPSIGAGLSGQPYPAVVGCHRATRELCGCTGRASRRYSAMSTQGWSAAVLRSNLSLGRKEPELDGLRGIAIFMVVFFHYFWGFVHVEPGSI